MHYHVANNVYFFIYIIAIPIDVEESADGHVFVSLIIQYGIL